MCQIRHRPGEVRHVSRDDRFVVCHFHCKALIGLSKCQTGVACYYKARGGTRNRKALVVLPLLQCKSSFGVVWRPTGPGKPSDGREIRKRRGSTLLPALQARSVWCCPSAPVYPSLCGISKGV